MKTTILILALLGCLASFTTASESCPNCASFEGQLTNISQRGSENEFANIQITLNPGNRVTYPTSNGKFSFYDVQPGSYRLDVHALNYFFDPVYVEITPKGIEAYIINYQAKRKETIPTRPFNLASRGGINYFEIEEDFNILSMAKSGYGLMIGMMILMMFCAKNMPSMDEMEDAQRQQVEGEGEGRGAAATAAAGAGSGATRRR